ncbi:amidohydrolase [Sandarakinorhabdus limnophila]|uniref:amidohydrolase n=2 Tax=Sandarakinorhabdus limnophila TaxID=210512 RepID=UPI0026F1BF29|nr:amidohydrolase [Sandarakinorhabdus limnophila]
MISRRIGLRCIVALASPASAADLLIHGGPILTMVGDRPHTVAAVVVEGGRIAFAGPLAQAQRIAGAETQRLDLKGRTLLPGLIDAHSHLAMAVDLARRVNVSGAPVGTVASIADLVGKLADGEAALKIALNEWLVGWGYDASLLAEKRDLTRRDLDARFPDRPVLVMHVSGHGAVLNSVGLAAIGVTPETKAPEGGLINCEADGRTPNGQIWESALMLAGPALKPPPREQRLQNLAAVQQLYAKNGYTLANDGFTSLADLDLLQAAAAQGRLVLDVVSLPSFVDFKRWAGNSAYPVGQWQGRLKLQGIKITQDGSPQGRTAYMTTPYLHGGPTGQENWRAQGIQPYPAFLATAKAASAAGLQLFIHANGDAAMDDVINAVDTLKLPAGHRTIVIHSQVQRPDQLPRYAAMGITPSYFTNHTYFWGDVHRGNFGEERAAHISPIRSAMALGLNASNHSDFIVTPLDPMFILWTSMARTTRSGFVLGSAERLNAWAGLKALTINPAWAYREEGRRGSIEVGKLADFTLLSANPLTTPVARIRGIKVLGTMKEGRFVWETVK